MDTLDTSETASLMLDPSFDCTDRIDQFAKPTLFLLPLSLLRIHNVSSLGGDARPWRLRIAFTRPHDRLRSKLAHRVYHSQDVSAPHGVRPSYLGEELTRRFLLIER